MNQEDLHRLILALSNQEQQISDLNGRLEDLERLLTVQDYVPWTDYSGTSTIVGWTGGVPNVQNKLRYKKGGNLVFVQFGFHGTNPTGTAVNFTLPFTIATDEGLVMVSCVARDNSVYGAGRYDIKNTTTTINCYPLLTAGAGVWIAGGARGVWGEFFYEAA